MAENQAEDKTTEAIIPDWRIGATVLPILSSYQRVYGAGKVLAVHQSPYMGVSCANGVLEIQLSNSIIYDAADNWQTA